MKNQELRAFKISDRMNPAELNSRSASATTVTQPQKLTTQSVGFGRLERMLENEDPDRVSNRFTTLLDKLESLEQQAQTPRDKSTSSKAIAAIERAADLIDFLYKTKASLEGKSK